MTLKEFNSKYVYQSDKEKYGFSEVWEVPTLDKNGQYKGDCESYCRFLKKNIKEFKDWNYYYCKLNGVGHCVLMRDLMVIDCNIKEQVTLDSYIKYFSVTELKRYNTFVIFSKILLANIINVFRRP